MKTFLLLLTLWPIAAIVFLLYSCIPTISLLYERGDYPIMTTAMVAIICAIVIVSLLAIRLLKLRRDYE